MLKRIVFVCVENANRRQMAEAFARMIGGSSVEAYSAGSKPSGKINLKAVDAMAKLGYDLTEHDSKPVTQLPNVTFDMAVTMGCGDACPMIRANRRVAWDIPDPKDFDSEHFYGVRDMIRAKVTELVTQLRSEDATAIEGGVRSKYGAVATSGLSTKHDGVKAVAEAFGYSAEELNSVPAEANMGLSCGNPTASANLRSGEVVVDLGCGGGLDVFLAARKVGPSGRAIGIDMTEEMIELAKSNANKSGLSNTEFHLATIGCLPLPDSSVDCVISNCVINLASDKPAVFREIIRVLKPKGRLAVSEIALRKPLPDEIAKDVMAYVGCIAGAILIDDYRIQLATAGFAAVEVVDSHVDLNAYAQVEGQNCCCPPSKSTLPVASENCQMPSDADTLHTRLRDLLSRHDINEYAASVRVFAVKQ